MRKVTLGQNSFQVPTKWAECNEGQISHCLVSQLYLHEALVSGQSETVERTKFSILKSLAPDMDMTDYNMLNPSQKVILYQIVRWAFTARIETKPFEFIEVAGTKYYLPAEKYTDTTSIEFALFNIYYLAYGKRNIKSQFYLLLASMLRPLRADFHKFEANPEKYNGDKREPYNGNLASARAQLFETEAPFGLLQAVFQYWEKMNNDFLERNKTLFDEGDLKALFDNGEGWLSMLEDIAETSVMGDLDKVYSTPVVNLYMYLRHKQVKLREAERQAERQRHHQNNDD